MNNHNHMKAGDTTPTVTCTCICQNSFRIYAKQLCFWLRILIVVRHFKVFTRMDGDRLPGTFQRLYSNFKDFLRLCEPSKNKVTMKRRYFLVRTS